MSNHWDNVEYDLSASRLKTHASCPEKYRLKYIEGFVGTKGKSGYGEMGSWVHLAIENVLREYPDEENQHVIHSRLNQEFHRLGDTDEIDTAVIDDKQKETAIGCLEVAARFIAANSPDIRAIEKSINFHIDNPSIDRTPYGKIDVVTEDGEIWDWKTGTVQDYTARDELIQGAIYMGGYYNEYGELPSRIRFVYINPNARKYTDGNEDGPCEREIEPSQDNWNQMLNYARRLVEDEKTGVYQAQPESGKCYWCEFEGYCASSLVGVGGVNNMVAAGDVDMWDAL